MKMEMPLKQTLLTAANAIEAAAALALSNAQRALSDAERHAAFAKDAVAKIKAAQEAEEMPSAVLDASALDLCTCDACGLPCRGGASAQGFCGPCAYEYDNALKKHPEEFAEAMLEGPDALRLLILRLSAETIRDDEELHDVYYCGAGSPGPMEQILNRRAAELLERLPASFAPWWKQRWTYANSCERSAVRKAEGWVVSEQAPILRHLAALFTAEQNKVCELEKWRKEEMEALDEKYKELERMRAENTRLKTTVDIFRQLVVDDPTLKLMKSNPELFGGEALFSAKKEPMRPTATEPSTEALFMALTEAQYQEMLKAETSSPLSSSPPPSPILVPDQPTVCAAGGCIECPPAEPEAEQTRICCVGCGKPKPDYNNPRWPSPRAKRFAKHIATHSGKDAKTIKTHEDALQFLAQRANISVEALLKMSEHDYQVAHASWTSLGNGTAFYTGVRSTPWWR